MVAKVERIEFAGWKNCLRIKDEAIELIVTTDVGPRIVGLSAPGGENVLCVTKEYAGQTGGDEWVNYGGHRLWHAPEVAPRTYAPDNSPVEWKEIEGGAWLSAGVEAGTGIKKELEITLDGGTAKVHHRLTNCSVWPVQLAAWAITVVDAGGMEIMPIPRPTAQQESLLPGYSISLWPYTDLSDARIRWGKNYITLTQDADCVGPTKIGYASEHGWAMYCNKGDLFVKRFELTSSCCADANPYPDFGCSYETYTCDFMLEMESLSRLHTLAPGEAVEHSECWNVYTGVTRPAPNDEAAMDALARQYVK